jgi:TRAP-type transport system small permease protein
MAARGFTDTVRQALAGLARLCLVISILLLIAITALVAAQVVARNIFAQGLPWADELARFCGIAMVYLTIPYLLDKGQHIAVEFVPQSLAGAARMLVLVIADVSVVAFGALTLYGFYAFLERAAKFTTPALGMPNLFFYMPALAGMGLLTLVALARTLTLLRGPGSA